MSTEVDIAYIIGYFNGDLWAARGYCLKIAELAGPLGAEFHQAVREINQRIREESKS